MCLSLAQAEHDREAPADRTGSTIGVALITTQGDSVALSAAVSRAVPEKWFAANCGVITEALLTSLLITI